MSIHGYKLVCDLFKMSTFDIGLFLKCAYITLLNYLEKHKSFPWIDLKLETRAMVIKIIRSLHFCIPNFVVSF